MKQIVFIRHLMLIMIAMIIVIAGHSQQPFYNSKQFRLYSWDQDQPTNAWMQSTQGIGPWGISFWVENQQRMVIRPDGSVGIGYSFPTHALTVGSSNENALRLVGPYGSAGYGARLNFGDFNNAYIAEDVNDGLDIHATNGIVLDGLVSVGTSSLLSPLTVGGNGSGGTIKILPGATNGESGVGFFQNPNGTGLPWVISQGGWGNTGKLVFGYDGSRMVIQQNGNVGIGTNSPQALLDISGNGRLNGSYLIGSDITRFNNIPASKKTLFSLWVEKGIVANDFAVGAPTTWADHVFASGYKLYSLQEVASFIKTHHHLPDMPSESTIKKDGYTLHDMNTRLLQKIEELTLYVIEQQKEIDALKRQVKYRRKNQ